MAAAFELTRPEHDGRYAVTVYQQGWRLGGKGASGRGPAGRIEEHGLHLWMGFYENAFRLLRECYAELGRPPGSCPIVDWQDAFYPAPYAGLADRSAGGQWSTWTALMPPGAGLPGDPGRAPQRWTLTDYVLRSIGLVAALLERTAAPRGSPARADAPRGSGLLDGSPDMVVTHMLRLAQQLTPLATLAAVIEAMRLLQTVLGAVQAYPFEIVRTFHEAVEQGARARLRSLIAGDDELRRVWEIVDILLAVIRGSLREGLLFAPDGFDAIDRHDCREWLRRHGASPESVDGPFVRGLHDLALAYEDGDPARMRFAAGEGLRGSFRAFFNYRGSFFWKMRAGMGDVVFAPFYEVLRRRGVRFEFFHRLQNVRLSRRSAQPHVEALEFSVQAVTRGGRPYEPLVDVRGLPCWPAQPDWSQLTDGSALSAAHVDFEAHGEGRQVRSRTVRVQKEFDFVVLGIGLGAVPYVCRELMAREPVWREMVRHVATVPTQAFQIWMNEDMKALGWNEPPLSSLSAFVDPFGTWADMTQLVPREDWPSAPRSIAYFCGVLACNDALDPGEQRERVKRAAIHFLNHDIARLWPHAQRAPGQFRWELLVDPCSRPSAAAGDADESRFASQFWTANVNPSDRYVQSLPGSSAYRISPLDQQFDNLTVAGDWTKCGLNIGCVEAAVMSGRLAAHALSGRPALEDVAGFDHP
jgi:uncharacterized protein with NAD-binding domain and iron-sulfur cluster